MTIIYILGVGDVFDCCCLFVFNKKLVLAIIIPFYSEVLGI